MRCCDDVSLDVVNCANINDKEVGVQRTWWHPFMSWQAQFVWALFQIHLYNLLLLSNLQSGIISWQNNGQVQRTTLDLSVGFEQSREVVIFVGKETFFFQSHVFSICYCFAKLHHIYIYRYMNNVLWYTAELRICWCQVIIVCALRLLPKQLGDGGGVGGGWGGVGWGCALRREGVTQIVFVVVAVVVVCLMICFCRCPR